MKSKEIVIGIAYKELIKIARALDYSVRIVSGSNGLCYFWERRIEIGRDLSPILRTITLAHEIGHAIDHKENIVSANELVMIVKLPAYYVTSQQYYDREKKAWTLGKKLLEDMNSYDIIKDEYIAERKRGLKSYYHDMMRVRKEGKDKPTHEEYLQAYQEVLALVSKNDKLVKTS